MTHFVHLPRPMPTPWTAAELFTKLLGCDVRARAAAAPAVDAPALVCAHYADDERRPALLAVAERSTAFMLGAALSRLPRDVAHAAVAAGSTPLLLENFAEVMNVGTRLFVYPATAHVRLTHASLQPRGLPEELRQLVAQARSRVAWSVEVEGYGGGRLGIFDVLP